jgi:myo-inositol-1(or 4)-monophosphatase
MLQTGIEAARLAGQVIAKRYSARHNVTMKGFRDIVTEADTAAEAAVLDLIRARFPDHAILSEEAGGETIVDGIVWVVDPLDGTTNYAHRIPTFCVSIGVVEAGEPLVGIVHDPLRNETFVAERGGGAALNGESLRVSGVSNFGHTLLGLDWTHDNAGRGRVLAHLAEIMPRCGTVRALGSAALGLAYVAAGRLDGYFHLSLKPWDAAAGALLVQEAGGRCTMPGGEPYRIDSSGCVATNGLVHEELLGLMNRPA